MINHNISVYIYSGDADGVVTVTETIESLKLLNLRLVEDWRPWFVSGQQVGGYVTKY